MTIRYATIWNDQRRRPSPLEASEQEEAPKGGRTVRMENAPATAQAAPGSRRKVCSGERLAALLDTQRWSQRRPKRRS